MEVHPRDGRLENAFVVSGDNKLTLSGHGKWQPEPYLILHNYIAKST